MRIFLTVVSTYFHTENTVRNIAKIDQIEKFGLPKKPTVVSDFYSIGKIRHNFLVPKLIELACKTFMPIQTLDIHSVSKYFQTFGSLFIYNQDLWGYLQV